MYLLQHLNVLNADLNKVEEHINLVSILLCNTVGSLHLRVLMSFCNLQYFNIDYRRK